MAVDIFIRTLAHRLYRIKEKNFIRRDDDYILALTKHGEKVLYKNENADVILIRVLKEIDRQALANNYVFIDLEVIV